MNRWTSSRWMVIGAVLCLTTYIPALLDQAWIAVFQTIATAYITLGMAKNGVDEWGRTRRIEARAAAETDTDIPEDK